MGHKITVSHRSIQANGHHPGVSKFDVIYDTNANNEVDDQHALAYLLFNGIHFNVEGITVNATSIPDGFDIVSDVQDHYDETRCVMQLCGDLYGKSNPLRRWPP